MAQLPELAEFGETLQDLLQTLGPKAICFDETNPAKGSIEQSNGP